jgi:hypothetical protein
MSKEIENNLEQPSSKIILKNRAVHLRTPQNLSEQIH